MKYISIGLGVVLVLLQYQIWFHHGGLKSQYESMKQKAQAAETQNKVLTDRNVALKAEVDDLKNGYEAVSEIARNQFHYIQAGETFYQISP